MAAALGKEEEKWEKLELVGHTSIVTFVAFSPIAADRLVTASTDNTVRLWDSATGEQVAVIQRSQPVATCTFSLDGKLLAVPSCDKMAIRLWSVSSREFVRDVSTAPVKPTLCALSPGGVLLAHGSGDDIIVRLCNVETGEVFRELNAADNVMRFDFSPDGEWLLSNQKDMTVRLWDVASGELRRTWQNGPLQSAFSPDSSHLATKTSNGLVLMDLLSMGCTFFEPMIDAVSSALSPDGKLLAASSASRVHILARVGTGPTEAFKGRQTFNFQHPTVLDFSPDGSRLAIGTRSGRITIFSLPKDVCGTPASIALARLAAFSDKEVALLRTINFSVGPPATGKSGMRTVTAGNRIDPTERKSTRGADLVTVEVAAPAVASTDDLVLTLTEPKSELHRLASRALCGRLAHSASGRSYSSVATAGSDDSSSGAAGAAHSSPSANQAASATSTAPTPAWSDAPSTPASSKLISRAVESSAASVTDADRDCAGKLLVAFHDLGGQPEFEAALLPILRDGGVYLAFMRLDDAANSVLERPPRANSEMGGPDPLDGLLSWLTTICARSSEGGIFIVCPFLDEIARLGMPEAEMLRRINSAVDKRLSGLSHPAIARIRRNDTTEWPLIWPISNIAPAGHCDHNIQALLRNVTTSWWGSPAANTTVPLVLTTFTDLLKSLAKAPEEDSPVLLKDIRGRASARTANGAVPAISLNDAVMVFALATDKPTHPRLLGATENALVFLHSIGHVTFFCGHETLGKLVILDQHWLLKQLTRIIRDPILHKLEPETESALDVIRMRNNDDWTELYHKCGNLCKPECALGGCLYPELFHALLQTNDEMASHLLSLMEKFGLAIKARRDLHIVPSLLPRTRPNAEYPTIGTGASAHTIVLAVHFKKRIVNRRKFFSMDDLRKACHLPLGFLEQLLVAYLGVAVRDACEDDWARIGDCILAKDNSLLVFDDDRKLVVSIVGTGRNIIQLQFGDCAPEKMRDFVKEMVGLAISVRDEYFPSLQDKKNSGKPKPTINITALAWNEHGQNYVELNSVLEHQHSSFRPKMTADDFARAFGWLQQLEPASCSSEKHLAAAGPVRQEPLRAANSAGPLSGLALVQMVPSSHSEALDTAAAPSTDAGASAAAASSSYSTSQRSFCPLLVIDDWSTKTGGIASFNMQLANDLARTMDRDGLVFVFVSNWSEELEKEANERIKSGSQIRLIGGIHCGIQDPRPVLDAAAETRITTIIGHAHITGALALSTSKLDALKNAKLWIVNHCAKQWYDALRPGKDPRESQQSDRELLLVEAEAEVVWSVGPAIHKHWMEEFQTAQLVGRVQTVPHLKMYQPSLNRFFCEPRGAWLTRDLQENSDGGPMEEPRLLLLGRLNDSKAKGVDLGMQVFKQLHDEAVAERSRSKPRLIVRGFETPEEIAAFRSQYNMEDMPGNIFRGNIYGPPEEIMEDMARSDIVLMPSPFEPYGLVGLEAIANGIPVICNAESGLAKNMQDVAGELARPLIPKENTPECWSKAIRDLWRNRGMTPFVRASRIRDKFLEVEANGLAGYQCMMKVHETEHVMSTSPWIHKN